MARIEKTQNAQTRARPSLFIYILAALLFVGGVTIIGWISHDLIRYGLPQKDDPDGQLPLMIAILGLTVIPPLLFIWLSVQLLRLQREGWVLTFAVAIPMIALYGVGLVLIALLLQRSVRWRFGIGPDELLAEIDAREVVSLAQLATTFKTSEDTVLSLLEQSVSLGIFCGAIDRKKRMVYSVDTIIAQENIQRCPHCGGATEAVGNLAECPYCGTRYAHLTGLDFPMPTPIGLAILGGLDALLTYWWAFMAVIWCAFLFSWDLSEVSFLRVAFAYFMCGAVPLLISGMYFFTGRRLKSGAPVGWLLQAILLPPSLPYLLRAKIKVLYGRGVESLVARFKAQGALSFAELGTALSSSPADAASWAVYLTATGVLPGVLDWQKDQIMDRARLKIDGRKQCAHCGAPYRIGGWCAYCATGMTGAVKTEIECP